jgi:hypothetical protein
MGILAMPGPHRLLTGCKDAAQLPGGTIGICRIELEHKGHRDHHETDNELLHDNIPFLGGSLPVGRQLKKV